MSTKPFPHKLIPPSERYPKWSGNAGEQLVYLGWGERNFTREPIPVHSNPGWTYWILTEGRVEITFDDATRRFAAGEGFICGPNCPFGFPLQEDATSTRLLIWIWNETPSSGIDVPTDQLHYLRFSQDQLRLLNTLHEQTRIEILEDSPDQSKVLQHIHALLDLVFQRARKNKDRKPDAIEIRNARQWMLNNLCSSTPVANLARYLNLSPMTLHRKFVEEIGEPPGKHFQRLKMSRCEELLAMESYSIKRVAYEMGYKHPQDFSRAYKNYFGHSPRLR